MGREEEVSVMNKFSVMMVSSGHGIDTVRKTLMNGIKGHVRKVARCKTEGKQFHRCAATSAKSRKSKKLLQKSSWFKNTSKEQEGPDEGAGVEANTAGGGTGGGTRTYTTAQEILKIRCDPKEFKRNRQPSTVLFVEFSRGGSLQKAIREVVDRLEGLLGFSIRVTERGGTPLSSLLSNKSLWRGQECGRGECKVCIQPGEKLEDCKRRNILYESECLQCNGVDEWKTRDTGSLEDNRGVASIYVGETARSLCERGAEHWGAAVGGQENSHMVEHQGMVHEGNGDFKFRFRIVRAFKSSLDRQIAEAIRIHKRGGGILNRKGEFNRCSLTRLVLDNQWEKEKWEQAWEHSTVEGGEDENAIAESKKFKANGQLPRPNKRIKLELEEGGTAWGDPLEEDEQAKIDFLHSFPPAVKGGQQSKIIFLTGINWAAYEIALDLVKSAAQYSEDFYLMMGWGD